MNKQASLFLGIFLTCSLHAQEPTPASPEEPAVPVMEPTPQQEPVSSPETPAPQPAEAPLQAAPESEKPAEAETEPAPYPTEKIVPKEPKTKTPRVIPKTFGDTTGEVFIGHRSIVDRYAGWGWIRAEKDTWRKGRWVMLEEKPGVIQAPGRFLGHPDRDNGTQYKFYGQWAPYKGYEPNFDVFVDVFQIKGFELIGPGEIPKMSPPRSNRGRSNSEGPYQRRAGVTR